MLTLAIDTSGLCGSVALLDGETCLAERELELGRQHGQSLVPEVSRLLAEQGRRPSDVQLVAVSSGPGSFTGLRVGIVFAKTLAYAVRCPAVAVETFLAIAHNAPADVGKLSVVEDAQRGELFDGAFRREPGGDWQRPDSIDIVSVETWIAELRPADVVAGPGLARIAERIAANCRVLPADFWRPRAATVGLLGQRLLAAGAAHDPWSLEPLYLRRSSAEDKWDARQQAAVQPG